MNLEKIVNTGQITDYLTDSDEIEVRLVIGDQFVYTLSSDFVRGQNWFFLDSLSFPCFADETMSIQFTEFDDQAND